MAEPRQVDPLFDGHSERSLLDLDVEQRLDWIWESMVLLHLGERQRIEAQWEFVLHHPETCVQLIAERASREPALRRHYPVPSLRNLKFSRTSSYPYDDLPWIQTVQPGVQYCARAADDELVHTGSLDAVVQVVGGLVPS